MSDQELFDKGLATYRKVVAHNYMAHREVYELLRAILSERVPPDFTFLDLACGTATGSADALLGTSIARYVGVDISAPSLAVAREALARLPCRVELRCQDFVETMQEWSEPVQVIWIGQSLHHLPTAAEKGAFMRQVRSALAENGVFVIWEPTCLKGEDRNDWLAAFEKIRPQWSAVSDEEFGAFVSHCGASDYSETSSTWLDLGRQAGFARVEELLIVPNGLARVYCYSA